jgi:hypothetical protein
VLPTFTNMVVSQIWLLTIEVNTAKSRPASDPQSKFPERRATVSFGQRSASEKVFGMGLQFLRPRKLCVFEIDSAKGAAMMLSCRRSLLGFLFIGMALTVFPPMSHAQLSYTLSVSPLTPASVNAFTAASPTATVTITPVNGYMGTVNLNCTVIGRPPGSTGPDCTTAPSSVTVKDTSPSSSVLTVTTTSQTGVGTYPISVTAVDKTGLAPTNGEQSSYLFVTPLTPSYTLSASALTRVPVNPGGVVSSTVAMTPVNGYKGTVTVFCTVTTPPGASGPFCTFTTPATSPFSTQLTVTSPTSTLTVSTTSQTGIGTYPISVTGVDANNLPPSNGAQSLALVVTPPLTASYSLTVSPLTPASINQFTAASATSTVTITPVNGYTGGVNLNCTVIGRPPGSTGPDCTLAPLTVGGGSVVSTLTVSTTSQTGCGTYPTSVTGVDGSGLAPSNGTQHLALNVVGCPLYGFVDLHTHPLTNIAFGGKLVYGGVDSGPGTSGSLLPADPACQQNVFAGSEAQALGPDASTHGGPGFTIQYGIIPNIQNSCGDAVREIVIHQIQSGSQSSNALGQPGTNASDPSGNAYGFPTFADWPVWNDLTHQKMWVEWIRRAHTYGLNVMVALATNSKTLGDMTRGPGDTLPTDDQSSADSQIDYTKKFVANHPDLMAIALSSADVQTIIHSNRLAVVLGVEIDRIGNFQQAVWSPGPAGVLVRATPYFDGPTVQVPPPPTDAEVRAEVDRLFGHGVRYLFPIHVLDNAFGGTAVYSTIFNVSNLRESGHAWSLTCADPNDGIAQTYPPTPPSTIPPDFWAKLQQDLDDAGVAGGMAYKLGFVFDTPPPGPPCPAGIGHRNVLGLTPSGRVAINEMMRLGMLIDIDHMSEASAEGALAIAEQVPGGYPLNSGHNSVRGAPILYLGVLPTTERSLTKDQYQRLGQLHGMAGVGSAGRDAQEWLSMYNSVIQEMGSNAAAGFGTDFNGLEFGMPPRKSEIDMGTQTQQNKDCMATCSDIPPDAQGRLNGPLIAKCQNNCTAKYPPVISCRAFCGLPSPAVQYTSAFPPSTDGSKTWNYNTDGVAHYGLLPDFLKDVAALPGGAAMINGSFMNGAEYFYRTWAKAEGLASSVQLGVAPCSPFTSAYADVRGSGMADAIVVNSYGIVVRPSDGSTQFLANQNWTTDPFFGLKGTFFADVDGDGKADVIAVNQNGISVRRSDGAKFGATEMWSSYAYYGALGTYFADVTGDRNADAIVVNPTGIVVRRSDGKQFAPKEEIWAAQPYYGALGTYFADVTGDGKADAIAVNPSGVTVRRSDGTQFLANESWWNFPITGSVYFADFNGDGKADLILVTSSGVLVYLSTGSGFSPIPVGPIQMAGLSSEPYYGDFGIYFADVTGDHKADAIVSNMSGVTVRQSNGLVFAPGAQWATGPYHPTSYTACLP